MEWIWGFGFLNFQQSEYQVRYGLELLDHNIKDEAYMMKSMATYDPVSNSSLL
jgi:hypothetical protein